MSEFDDHDLSDRLRRLAGPDPDEAAASAVVGRRVRRARRRRAAAWSSGAAVMVLAVVGAYAAGSQQSPSLRPATTDGVSVPIGTADTTSTVPVTAPGTTAIGATTVPAGPGSTAPPATVGTTTPSSAPTTPTSTAPTATSTSTPAATTAPPGPVTSSFEGVGGSITVRMQGGTLTLLSTNPAEGFSIDDTRTEPTRIEVRFGSESHSTRIRVEVVGGQMSPDIQEESDG